MGGLLLELPDKTGALDHRFMARACIQMRGPPPPGNMLIFDNSKHSYWIIDKMAMNN
jgi:hypothetical protein